MENPFAFRFIFCRKMFKMPKISNTLSCSFQMPSFSSVSNGNAQINKKKERGKCLWEAHSYTIQVKANRLMVSGKKVPFPLANIKVLAQITAVVGPFFETSAMPVSSYISDNFHFTSIEMCKSKHLLTYSISKTYSKYENTWDGVSMFAQFKSWSPAPDYINT